MISQKRFSNIISEVIRLSNVENEPLENILTEIEDLMNELNPETFINLMFNDYENERRTLMDFKSIGYILIWSEILKEEGVEDFFEEERKTNAFAFNFPLLLLNIMNFFIEERKNALNEGFDNEDDYIKSLVFFENKTKKIMDNFLFQK